MAAFVVHLGFTPADYWAMTVAERDAIISEHNRANKKRR